MVKLPCVRRCSGWALSLWCGTVSTVVTNDKCFVCPPYCTAEPSHRTGIDLRSISNHCSALTGSGFPHRSATRSSNLQRNTHAQAQSAIGLRGREQLQLSRRVSGWYVCKRTFCPRSAGSGCHYPWRPPARSPDQSFRPESPSSSTLSLRNIRVRLTPTKEPQTMHCKNHGYLKVVGTGWLAVAGTHLR